MRSLWSAVVSSALFFILGSGGLHPASAEAGLSSMCLDTPGSSLVIAEFYPCAVNGDEYIVLSNRAAEAVNLSGWTVTDGEGAILFSGRSVLPGESISLSEDAASYASAYGVAPDLHLPGWSSGPGATVTGAFRLADAGDSVALLAPDGSVSDTVVYGDVLLPTSGWSGDPVPALHEGEVARRVPGGDAEDTDAAGDWTPFREFRYGYTAHQIVSSEVGAGDLTCFVSPDCSLDIVLEALSAAQSSVRLCAYELSSSPVCLALRDANSRGVDVRVLVDALPVGGMSAAEVAWLSCLARDGADVRVLGGNLDDGIVRHVGATHAKYVVVDGSTVIALSENFVEDGVPTDRLFGNRGWGVSVEDQGLASFLASVFDDDSRATRADAWPWSEDPRCDLGAELPGAPTSVHPDGIMSPLTTSREAVVAMYISPDASVSGPFLAPIISSSLDVTFEQFQAELDWAGRWSDAPCLSPVLDAIVGVLEGGGSAKGIFDGSWYNFEDNSAAVSFLSASALASGAEPSFGLLSNESPVTSMHNKGLVLDDAVVISSNNWVYPSFARNRELCVVVGSEESASYFLSAFDLDWVPDSVPPVADAGRDIELPQVETVALDASGSWDDRAIAWFAWDLDGDGAADASGESATFTPPGPGTFIVRLEVEDAWGNTAADSIVLSFGPVMEDTRPAAGPAPAVPWALPLCFSLLSVALLAARKLNLLRASTRGKG